MPQKKAKAAKVKKPMKSTVKTAPKSPVGSVLKKAAKVVAKKVSTALGGAPKGRPELTKKVQAKAAPLKVAGKEKAAEKKAKVSAKVLPPAPAKKKASPVVAPVTTKEKAAPAKGKAVAPVAPAKSSGKKKVEVVVEVPAAKGVALLGKEGKKKRSSEGSAASKRRCREPGCEHDFLLSGFCRLHYIKNWRKIKRKEAILASGQLNNYVEELVNKYPDKYLDVIRQDLASEKDWAKVVVDLELESSDEEGNGDEDLEGVAEGVRREREFDDEGDTF